MKYFDYSFLESGMLPAGLVNVVEAIAELRERESQRKETYPDVFTRLAQHLDVAGVKRFGRRCGCLLNIKHRFRVIADRRGTVLAGVFLTRL